MTFQTTLANIELLPEGSGVSKMSGEELLERLALVFDYLPEGTTFQVNGEKVSITVPESLATQKAEAERLAEKAAQRARQGEYEKAKDIYRRVLELDPVHPNARRDLAMICVETGDNDEAKDYLIESLRLAPEDAWSLVVLANQYAKEDDHETACKFVRRALELKPGDPWALNTLATALMEQGLLEESLKTYEEAIASDPSFANAHYGRSMVLIRMERFADAAMALQEMFAQSKLQDSRTQIVFEKARSALIHVQNIIANNRLPETDALVERLSTEGETRSGYPVQFEEGPLDAQIVARIKMAWRHDADHHMVTLRDGDFPKLLKNYYSVHELMHLFMESAARDQGTNRWFVTTPETRKNSALALKADLRRLEKKGYRDDQVAGLINELVMGVNLFLFNCPIDMEIERRIWRDYPELRESQFCGLASIAHNSRKVTMDPKIRDFVPPTLLRINDILNGVFALFVDELFEGATAYADAYRKFLTFKDTEKLFALWKEKSSDLTPGSEYHLVDAFGEFLGIRDWYTWKSDRGFIPPDDILDDVDKEGATNPELLKAKAPASVLYLLDALERFSSMEPDEVKRIAFEIAVMGQEGIDYSSPENKYRLKSLPGKTMSGLQLMCLMYAGFKQVAPDMDSGMDLEDEYQQALSLFRRG
ncbi:MAG: tetratricopeptide repeat protein [Chthoniobacterales bacterium]|nr:tetratricopeptide repeat protein [Chthoniobacterales bacterium]